MIDWLRVEFDLNMRNSALDNLEEFDADVFVAAVRKALPKSRKLSAAEITRLRSEHATTIEPARKLGAEALGLERRLSDLVNSAYKLTPAEVKLMWDTAPARMPFKP
jgi:hypothetical protein